MANISIREVPEDVAQTLRRRAARNRRSLQRELILILERAASDEQALTAFQPPAMPRPVGDSTAPVRTIDDLLQELRRKFGADVLTPSTSTAIIREMRDAREAGVATRAGHPADRK